MESYVTIKNKNKQTITFIPTYLFMENNSKIIFNIYKKPVKALESVILKCSFICVKIIPKDFFIIGQTYTISYKKNTYEGYLSNKMEDILKIKAMDLNFLILQCPNDEN